MSTGRLPTRAVSYDIPGLGGRIWKPILSHWSTDSIIYARSAPPVNDVTGLNPFVGTYLSGAESVQRRDLIPGVALYLPDSNAGGGKIINKETFSIPSTSRQGDLGRNTLRGFGATQLDMTLRRQFQIKDRPSLCRREGTSSTSSTTPFWKPDKLPEFSALRAIDADAGKLTGKRRPERRPQSSVSNRGSAIGAAGP